MSLNAYNAYKRVQNTVDSPRSIEYRLLGQVTAALLDAQNHPKDAPKRVDAVLWNKSIWSAFRVDLVGADNKLPKDLKARLISLSIWVDRETFDILDNKSDLQAIIDVNKLIMEGLKPN